METDLRISSRMKFFSDLYRGIVKDNNDPESLGRCRIHIPAIYGGYDYSSTLLPWARPITQGTISVPDIEDIVWVMFEGGRKESPVYMTGFVSTERPIESTTKDIIYRKDKCEIYYDREAEELMLRVDDNFILININGIEISGFDMEGSGSIGGGLMYFDVVEVIE